MSITNGRYRFAHRYFSCDKRILCLELILAVLMATALLPGCGSDKQVSDPVTAMPVMDLAVGNTWLYQSRANEPGAPVVDVRRSIIENRQISYGGSEILVAHERVVPGVRKIHIPGGSRLLKNEIDGLYCYGYVDNEGVDYVSDPYLVAPAEASKGELFEVSPGAFLACVASDSLVETGFGEFVVDVFEYRLFEGTVIVPDVLVVPGVGLTRYYNIEVTEYLVGYEFNQAQ